MFLAAFSAIVLFFVGGFFLMFMIVGALASDEKDGVPKNSVLVIDLSQQYQDKPQVNPLVSLSNEPGRVEGLYDVVRIIHKAKGDKNVKGIYLITNGNGSGFAASEEIRNALIDFKTAKKFVYAYGDMISQDAYYVASVADRIYAGPAGSMDWSGFQVGLAFFKGTLEKLKIEPQIFYAGKFKSATEPLRATEMTPENELQTREWLGDLYNHFLVKVAAARNLDTATLHALANNLAIQTTQDAVQHRLIDGVKYDDEVKDEIRKKLGIDKDKKISFVSLHGYADEVNFKKTGSGRIALIMAEGTIVDGRGDRSSIGSEEYVKLIRKARTDKSIKAIVLRINSGGGSALASENIWREIALAKKDKPFVVSFGDVAASGGYYIAAGADSIFCSPNTITGSIGVFGFVPNMQGFFNEKLGVTFDEVSTAPHAGGGSVVRPLDEVEKKAIQRSIDRIYMQFKQRVAEGRKKDTAYVDSIAQGRVWSGEDALRLGLVDRIGGLQDAIECAARMAKLESFRLREYPEQRSWINELLDVRPNDPTTMIKKEIGEENFRTYQQLVELRQMSGVQARLPFVFYSR